MPGRPGGAIPTARTSSVQRRWNPPVAAVGRQHGWLSARVSAVLLQTVLGGFSPTGASTNGGWFALIVALMCIPFGGLLLALGIAKWLRNRSLARRR